MPGSIAFDIQNLKRRLDTLDAKGPISRGLQAALAMAQATNSLLYQIQNPDPSTGAISQGTFLRSEDFPPPKTTTIIGVGDNTNLAFSATVSPTPIVPGSFSISYTKHSAGGAGVLTEDGFGNIVGDPGELAPNATNRVDYQTGSIVINFDTAKGPDTGDVIALYNNFDLPVTGEIIGVGDGVAGVGTLTFDATLVETPVLPGSITVNYTDSASAPATLTDDGEGNLDDGGSGDLDPTPPAGYNTIDYLTGEIKIAFDTGKAPDPGNITADYSYDDYETAIRKASAALTTVVANLNIAIKA